MGLSEASFGRPSSVGVRGLLPSFTSFPNGMRVPHMRTATPATSEVRGSETTLMRLRFANYFFPSMKLIELFSKMIVFNITNIVKYAATTLCILANT